MTACFEGAPEGMIRQPLVAARRDTGASESRFVQVGEKCWSKGRFQPLAEWRQRALDRGNLIFKLLIYKHYYGFCWSVPEVVAAAVTGVKDR